MQLLIQTTRIQCQLEQERNDLIALTAQLDYPLSQTQLEAMKLLDNQLIETQGTLIKIIKILELSRISQ